MNRFEIVECMDVKEKDYEGSCVIMACATEPDFMLFFPISKENSKMINYVMQEDSKFDINTNILGIYKTMLDSWTSSDRYLTGIIMDSIVSEESKEEILTVKLALADSNGDLDSLIQVSFLHAIVLGAMTGSSIVVSDKLLEKMMPEDDEECPHQKGKSKKKDQGHFPEDKKIVDIAKKIMSGKIKDN
jgi:hypothetical protein